MIRFDEKTHQYFDGEKELISVTRLMRKHGLAPDYTAVRSDVLNAAAERGTLIHEEIEEYNQTGEIGFTTECANFAKYIKENNILVLSNEYIVHNDVAAGTVDLLLHDKNDNDGKSAIIADIKTTSVLHKDAVAWQLSIYNALDGYPATRGQAFHFDGDGNLKVVEIALKPKEEVERLFECERKGIIYTSPTVANEYQIEAIQSAEKIIAEAEAKKKEAEAQIAEIKDAILKAMEQNGVKTFESDFIKITYVAPSTRATIDSAKLKKELPEVAEKYTKTSETKASLRITIKEVE